MGFMIPVAEYFTTQEAREYYLEPLLAEGGGNPDDEPESGWYSRLSAPGYMDCTDWSGPFESADAALKYVMDMYEVDENGDELAEDDSAAEGDPTT